MQLKFEFLNTFNDCLRLRNTHLKGISIPMPWAAFASFAKWSDADGKIDSIDLYLSRDPLVAHDYFTVDFINPEHSGVYSGETRELAHQPGKEQA